LYLKQSKNHIQPSTPASAVHAFTTQPRAGDVTFTGGAAHVTPAMLACVYKVEANGY
jgi:hypothetical protein